MATTILLGIISIGILIFVHELGHFLMARAVGIRVEVFSIGWGKGLVSFKWKETKIQLGWIPFGGYCKLAGDSLRDDLQDSPDEYYSSSPFKRIFVALGGPVFNYIFAVLLFSMIIIIGYEIRTFSNRILLAEAQDITGEDRKTPAQSAGLLDGDVIVELNGKNITNWDDITENIVRNALKPIQMKVLREGTLHELLVVPKLDRETGRGLIGIYPWVEPVIGDIVPGEPAEVGGFEKGDIILSVDGVKILHHMDFYNAIKGKSGSVLAVIISRESGQKELILIPKEMEGYDSAGISFQTDTYRAEKFPVHISFGRGVLKSIEGVNDTVRGIYLVFSGKIRARSAVAGPAKLVYLSGVIAKEGFTYFLQVLSYISIAFFIMNLIPFPALDGSHVVISLYELIARKKPNLKVIQKIQAFGFIVLIAVLIFVTMNDISSFFGK
ncbi:MAG TPA: RIP metalloprotease RseP [Spirochaetes bacterium]|nr:RIP metalloprotease RseP [Spirochaetota bacterium]